MSSPALPDLVPGQVLSEHLTELLPFAGISGPKLVLALEAHFVGGSTQKEAIAQTGVNQSLLSRKVAVVQAVNARLASVSKYYR